jgi:hypothetical protein
MPGLRSVSVLSFLYVLVCLHRITTIKGPVWDSVATRNVVDLMTTTADGVIQFFEQLKTVIPPHPLDNGEEEGILSYRLTKLHHLKKAWQSEMESVSREGCAINGSGMSELRLAFRNLVPKYHGLIAVYIFTLFSSELFRDSSKRSSIYRTLKSRLYVGTNTQIMNQRMGRPVPFYCTFSGMRPRC